MSRSAKIAPGGATPRQLADALNAVVDGRVDAFGEVTLAANATTTTVQNPRVASFSVLVLSPITANAAAAFATTYVSARADGSFTLTHANNAQTDRTFAYGWIG